MSKRRQSHSPSPPAKLRRSQTPEGHTGLICSLPPTCHRHPAVLSDARALERHYQTYHTHVCQEKGCMAVFPDERLLELHFAECHDPISAIRKERGEKTFACFVPTCIKMFETPAKRRMHLIDAHHYPKEYFFAVTNKGIGGLLEKWGEGVSLVRPEWKARPGSKEEDQRMEAGPSEPRGPLTPPHDAASNEIPEGGPVNGLGLRFTEAESNVSDRVASSSDKPGSASGPSQPLGWTFGTNKPSARPIPKQAHKPPNGRQTDRTPGRESARKASGAEGTEPLTSGDGDTAMDDLASAMSSVSLVPRTIRFGRGGARAGFQRPQGRKKPANGASTGEAPVAVDRAS
ncbi:hypothetical protein CALVIDRAFT_594247 [Calocera viscosa TUFC12733]|uniref:C2H2-type domain-containing protein n=1 Tax=Calocera viscosa (strain TUFC12733) TaxID=1330018 RepID=A0A167S2Y5_CALVF|nr:hypothetical protein CALVIDRAFT_594247 [Calocera viscosa TUFC12733]